MPPVTSGFHMKGNAYRSLEEFVAASVPGGMDAVFASVSEETRTFLRQPFVAGSWYDVLPIDEITRALATITRLSHEELCRRFGEFTLERDKNGIYRTLLRFATADLLVRALPYTTKRYFDFVSLAVRNMDPRSYRVTVTGVPRAIAFSYLHITSVFIERAVEGAGAKNLVAKATTPQPAGTKWGRAVVQFERHLEWDL